MTTPFDFSFALQRALQIHHVKKPAEFTAHILEVRHLFKSYSLVKCHTCCIFSRHAGYEHPVAACPAFRDQPLHEQRACAMRFCSGFQVNGGLHRPVVCRPLFPRVHVTIAGHFAVTVLMHEIWMMLCYRRYPSSHPGFSQRLGFEGHGRLLDIMIVDAAYRCRVLQFYRSYHFTSI